MTPIPRAMPETMIPTIGQRRAARPRRSDNREATSPQAMPKEPSGTPSTGIKNNKLPTLPKITEASPKPNSG
jgi:hypothetical protein